MTYRELLKLYKQGKLEDSTKKQIEAEIEEERKSKKNSTTPTIIRNKGIFSAPFTKRA